MNETMYLRVPFYVCLQVKTKKWVVDLDISAPQILIPENFVDNAARMVILDLGHLHLYNKKLKPRQDSDVIEEGLF
jgi:hypothetical protein